MAEDGLEPADLLALDAFERDGEAFTPTLRLEIDADRERVDTAHDNFEARAFIDDVRVEKAASDDVVSQRDRLLVSSSPAEDGLETTDVLDTRASLLRVLEAGRRIRQAERR